MAGFHKKRRRPGPSKNEEKIGRNKEEERRSHPSNWLGNRYESVAGLTLKFDLVGTHSENLGQETRKFGREDACAFSVPCPGLCGGGSFELGTKISEIVAAAQPSADFNVVCQHKTYSGPSSVCGVTLKCHLDLSYRPIAERPAPAPAPAPEAA